MVAQNDDAERRSSARGVIVDHALQVLVDPRDISISAFVLPAPLGDLADDALHLLFAKVLLAAHLLPVRAQLHGACIEIMAVHVLRVAELREGHARFPHLASAEQHDESDPARGAWLRSTISASSVDKPVRLTQFFGNPTWWGSIMPRLIRQASQTFSLWAGMTATMRLLNQ